MSEEPRRNKAARQKQPYRHSSGSKSFLQRQHDLAQEQGLPVDWLEFSEKPMLGVENLFRRWLRMHMLV